MDTRTKARLESRAATLKALAHPTRLFLIEELERGEQCVGDLTRLLGVDVSTVSKHLSILKNVGLLQDERRGSQIFYSLRVPCVLHFFTCVESVLEAQQREHLELRK